MVSTIFGLGQFAWPDSGGSRTNLACLSRRFTPVATVFKPFQFKLTAVPQYQEKLHTSLKRWFQRLRPEGPVQRNNYFIQTDECLSWSSKIGSEDSYGIGWDNAPDNPSIDDIHFRSERQTLRRLPKSGGILFTIRTYMLPVREMCKEKWVPGRFASAIKSWGDDVARYKGLRAYKDVWFGVCILAYRLGSASFLGEGT